MNKIPKENFRQQYVSPLTKSGHAVSFIVGLYYTDSTAILLPQSYLLRAPPNCTSIVRQSYYPCITPRISLVNHHLTI